MINLVDKNGLPVASWGVSSASRGTNPGEATPMRTFGDMGAGNGSGTFGAPAAISPTQAGSTKALGFADPTKQQRGTRGRGPMIPPAPGVAKPQLMPDQDIGVNAVRPESISHSPAGPRPPEPTQEELDEYERLTRAGSESSQDTSHFWSGIAAGRTMRDTAEAAGTAAEEAAI